MAASDTGSGRLAAAHLLLEHLEPHELDRLMQFARSQRHPAGEVIFRKGDPGFSMMSIIEGRVKISVASPDGKEAVLAVLGPGEVLGEMAIIEDKDPSADTTALEACEPLVLQKRDFIPFLERNPAICIRLLRILCERLRRTSALVEDRAFLSLPARLAKTLLDLADSGGRETADGIRVDFNMSQKISAASWAHRARASTSSSTHGRRRGCSPWGAGTSCWCARKISPGSSTSVEVHAIPLTAVCRRAFAVHALPLPSEGNP